MLLVAAMDASFHVRKPERMKRKRKGKNEEKERMREEDVVGEGSMTMGPLVIGCCWR